jgi:lantibiotic protection ABC transporter MutE/EpiE family permease subunit
MLTSLKNEWLKTKRTPIRLFIILFPLLVAIGVTLVFVSTGYVVQSIVNQWSLLFASLFLALEIGLIDRHEKNSTGYRTILSSPANLVMFELGRILHAVLLFLATSAVLVIACLLVSIFSSVTVSLTRLLLAVLAVFCAALWQIPIDYWVSRISNMYVAIAVSLGGSLIGMVTYNLPFGAVWPFTWSALAPVRLMGMRINGLPVKAGQIVPDSSWVLIASVALFVVLSLLEAGAFKRQVEK